MNPLSPFLPPDATPIGDRYAMQTRDGFTYYFFNLEPFERPAPRAAAGAFISRPTLAANVSTGSSGGRRPKLKAARPARTSWRPASTAPAAPVAARSQRGRLDRSSTRRGPRGWPGPLVMEADGRARPRSHALGGGARERLFRLPAGFYGE